MLQFHRVDVVQLLTTRPDRGLVAGAVACEICCSAWADRLNRSPVRRSQPRIAAALGTSGDTSGGAVTAGADAGVDAGDRSGEVAGSGIVAHPPANTNATNSVTDRRRTVMAPPLAVTGGGAQSLSARNFQSAAR